MALSKTTGEAPRSWWGELVQRLNGPWHERAVYIYLTMVLLHWAEHIAQAVQVFVLGWARPDSRGVLGQWFPVLISSEALHWVYALLMIIGLFLLRPGFGGRARTWWTISLAIQGWHFFEHTLLQGQAVVGANFLDSQAPISILQVWVPRVELHLIYNALVFIPMVIAVYFHMYPPRGEPSLACTCSRRAPLQAAA
jgi:hypothetical protein